MLDLWIQRRKQSTACVDRQHTHPFNGPFSGTTQVSRYQKGKTNLDFTEARESEWQWHQLGHLQVCISLQTDNHASTPPLKFFTGQMPFLPPNQQRQSTEGVVDRQNTAINVHKYWLTTSASELITICSVKFCRVSRELWKQIRILETAVARDWYQQSTVEINTLALSLQWESKNDNVFRS